VEVARRFVPEGVITKLAFKSEGTPDIIYSSELKELKYKLAVLVNGMTASASEIIAGAVQDTNSGVIIGTRTFGKSKVQNIIPILTPSAFKKYEQQLGVKLVDAYDLLRYYGVVPFDSEIVGWTKMTTGEYLTPNGRVIDGVGIEPDIFVEDPIAVLGINIQTVQFLQKKIKPGLGSEGINVPYNRPKTIIYVTIIDTGLLLKIVEKSIPRLAIKRAVTR
jgi:carboxyl-terminal processing protease